VKFVAFAIVAALAVVIVVVIVAGTSYSLVRQADRVSCFSVGQSILIGWTTATSTSSGPANKQKLKLIYHSMS
jgi:hypothetical protein